jgi:threonine dehydrogenase-like Zn-dependent dehydrogenase
MRDESPRKVNPTVVFRAPGVVDLAEYDIPVPGAGEVLIETRRSLISTGTELTILSGDFPAGSSWASLARYPFVAGYSNVGDVVAVGEGVSDSLIGCRVASMSPHARYASAPVAETYPTPTEARLLDELTLTSLAQIVMNGMRRADIRWGDAVVVYGLGLLGQLAVRFARRCGAFPVVGVDIADGRCALLPEDRAVFGVNPAQQPVEPLVSRVTRGRMADVIVEATGHPDLIPGEFASFKPSQGRFLMLSSPRGSGTLFNFHDLSNAPSHTIIGAHLTSHPPVESPQTPWTLSRNAELFHALLADGELDLTPLITDHVPFAQAARAYENLAKDRSSAMAVILDWDSGIEPARVQRPDERASISPAGS